MKGNFHFVRVDVMRPNVAACVTPQGLCLDTSPPQLLSFCPRIVCSQTPTNSCLCLRLGIENQLQI